jgi:hypothetical protein
LKNKCGRLEKEVDELEKELKQHDEDLLDPVKFKELSSEAGFFDAYEEKQKKLSDLMRDWEESIEELERIEAEGKEKNDE